MATNTDVDALMYSLHFENTGTTVEYVDRIMKGFGDDKAGDDYRKRIAKMYIKRDCGFSNTSGILRYMKSVLE